MPRYRAGNPFPKIILNPGPGPKRWRKKNKFNAKKVPLDGYWFDSKAEAVQYSKLKLLVRAGKISDLKVHPKFPLVINGISVGSYAPDFSFMEDGKRRFQDVKNPITASIARLRIKVFEALYGVDVELVGLPGKKWLAFVGFIDEKITAEEAVKLQNAARRRGTQISVAVRKKKKGALDGGNGSKAEAADGKVLPVRQPDED